MLGRILRGLMLAGLCCALLAGCSVRQGSGLSVTVYGRVESIEEGHLTLQIGTWEEGAFVPDEDSLPITVPADQELAVQYARGVPDGAPAFEDLQVGTVVRFTVTAALESGERITAIEVMQQPAGVAAHLWLYS